MKINALEYIFLPEEKVVRLSKQLGEDFFVDMGVAVLSEKFVEYQKSLLEEFFADLINYFESEEDLWFFDIKTRFEEDLKALNGKLQLFADKVASQQEGKFEIKGFVQIVYGENYLASLIGETSIIIFRGNKLNSIVPNEIDENWNIDLFSEIIEGKIENWDQVIFVGADITNYLKKEDLAEALNVAFSSWESFVDVLKEMLEANVDLQKIGFIFYFEFSFPLVSSGTAPSKINVKGLLKKVNLPFKLDLQKISKFAINNKLAIIFALIFGVIFLFVYALYHVNVANQKGVEYAQPASIQDIKKQIEDFVANQSLTPQERKKRYNQILQTLNELEQKGLYVKDVAQLKNELEAAYYQAYNIGVISSFDGGGITKITEFDQQTAQKLQTARFLAKTKNGIWIAYASGALGNILPQGQPLLIEGLPEDEQLTFCEKQPTNNGLICVSNKNRVYSFANGTYALVVVNGKEINYPVGGVGTFFNKYFYTLVNSPELWQNGIIDKFKMKDVNYVQELNYQVGYKLVDPAEFEKVVGNQWFGGMYVNWNFVVWSKNKDVILLWRNDPLSDKINRRVLPREWGDEEVLQKITADAKIRGFELQQNKANYITLFDRKNWLLAVYRQYGEPGEMKLVYKWAIVFKTPEPVLLVGVDDEIDPNLYILTPNALYQAKIMDFINS